MIRKFLAMFAVVFFLGTFAACAADNAPPPLASTGDEALLGKFNELWVQIQGEFVRGIPDTPKAKRDCFEKTMTRGIGACLDDAHSVYHSASDMKMMMEEQVGEFGGIGVSLSYFYGEVIMNELIEGLPAALSGKFKIGDSIVGVDGEDVHDKPIGYMVKKLRGAKGTEVVISVKREGRTLEPITLKRANVDVPSVEFAKIDNRTALIKVKTFGDKTDLDFAKAIHNVFKDKNGQSNLMGKRIVIDLRNNTGGLVTIVRNMSALFARSLDDICLIEKMRSREQILRVGDFMDPYDARASIDYVQTGLGILAPVPTVVLVNEYSASASEIFSGLLQQWGRAKIVGTKTFGKGSVQRVFRLADNDGLSLTIAEYLLGDQRVKVNGVGITPDVFVENTIIDGKRKALLGKHKPLVDLKHDAQLVKALEVLNTRVEKR